MVCTNGIVSRSIRSRALRGGNKLGSLEDISETYPQGYYVKIFKGCRCTEGDLGVPEIWTKRPSWLSINRKIIYVVITIVSRSSFVGSLYRFMVQVVYERAYPPMNKKKKKAKPPKIARFFCPAVHELVPNPYD